MKFYLCCLGLLLFPVQVENAGSSFTAVRMQADRPVRSRMAAPRREPATLPPRDSTAAPARPPGTAVESNAVPAWCLNLPDRADAGFIADFLGRSDLLPEQRQLLRAVLTGPFSGAVVASEFPEMQFLNALLRGGMLASVKSPRPDHRQAYRELLDLHRRYPDNGAYPLFAAAIKGQRQGLVPEVVRLVRAALRAPVFNAHYLELTRLIKEGSFRSSAAFYQGIVFLAQIPVPDFSALHPLLTELMAQDLVPAAQAQDFAANLAAPALESDGQHEFLFWGGLEYAFARKIMRFYGQGADMPRIYMLQGSELERSLVDFDRHRAAGRCPFQMLDDLREAQAAAYFAAKAQLDLP